MGNLLSALKSIEGELDGMSMPELDGIHNMLVQSLLGRFDEVEAAAIPVACANIYTRNGAIDFKSLKNEMERVLEIIMRARIANLEEKITHLGDDDEEVTVIQEGPKLLTGGDVRVVLD